LKNHLQQAIKDCNNRPHDVLKGLTPTEVLNGKLPVQVSFANKIANAKIARLKENTKSKCCSYSLDIIKGEAVILIFRIMYLVRKPWLCLK
jgi:hypothetical protein